MPAYRDKHTRTLRFLEMSFNRPCDRPWARFVPAELLTLSVDLRYPRRIVVIRRRRIARPERTLRQDAVGPASVLKADCFEQAGRLDADGLVQALRRHVGDIDIGNHLATAGSGAGINQRGRRRRSTPAFR
jgi:hypothetical protein